MRGCASPEAIVSESSEFTVPLSSFVKKLTVFGFIMFGIYVGGIGLFASAQSAHSWEIAQGIWLAWMGRWLLRESVALWQRIITAVVTDRIATSQEAL